MAIVKGALHSDLASGNMGSLCYSRWRGIQVCRAAWSGTVPNTGEQINYQDDLRTCAQYWGGTLTAAQRQKWNDAATDWKFLDRFGNPYRPSGYMLFMKQNMVRLRIAYSITATPVSKKDPAYGTDWIINVDVATPATNQLWETWQSTPARVEFWRAGPYDSGGRHPIAGEWRLKTHRAYGYRWYDYDIIGGKFYWYRSRWIEGWGHCSNFHEQQVEIN